MSQPFVFGSSATTTLTTTSTVTLINSGSTITGSNLFGNNKVLSTTGSSLPSLPKLNSIAAPSTSSSVPLTTTFTFGASGTSKPTENQVSTNLFQFGTPKEPEKKLFATNLQVPAATTASLAIPSTFSFGPPKPSGELFLYIFKLLYLMKLLLFSFIILKRISSVSFHFWLIGSACCSDSYSASSISTFDYCIFRLYKYVQFWLTT